MNRTALAAVLAVTVLGAALRFYGLADESLRLDEGYVYARISNSYFGALTHRDAQWQGALFTLIEKVWCDVFGHSEFALRFVPALFGVLAVPALYLLGATLLSSGAGIIAALFLAVNPCAIYFSQDARPYSLFLLLSIVSTDLAIRFLRAASGARRLPFALTAIAALYAHPYGVFLLPFYAALPYLASAEQLSVAGKRRYFKTLAGVFVAYLPMLLVFAHTLAGKMQGRLHDADFIPRATLPLLAGTFTKYFMSAPGAIIVGLIVVPALILAFFRRRAPAGLRIPLALAVCFLLIPWLASQILTPVYFFRYTIPALAALLLILGWALATLRAPLRILLILIVVGLSADALADYYTKVDKDPWRQTVSLLRPRLRSGDLVIVNPAWAARPLRYYWTLGDSVEIYAPWNAGDVQAHLAAAPRFWLITAYGTSGGLRDTLRHAVDSCGLHEWSLSVRDSVVVNPRAYLVGDIRADLYRRKPPTEKPE
jgi:4-amino-4-deoxy-L-arabinose transferase-like glycosyltransferase